MTSACVKKKKDPGAFKISCTIGILTFAKTLCDLGASVNLMPYDIFHKIGLDTTKTTKMKLLMADRSIKNPIRVLHDVLVKVDRFIYPTDFVILDCERDFEIPIIFGRTFLATEKVLVDIKSEEIKFRLNNEVVSFNICKTMTQPMDLQTISVIDIVDGHVSNHVDVVL
ncbi:uncharacterized protein LOC124885730 [Capsicum annuum]|uniref:uncharacterized protein LOC124885730 n=1 Tax=Capsicum annuum TaxID=4072 RepID=UPI001FB0540F|nr:uncharacterized protein LOC124885730 [Capsicum annuum]